MIKEFPSAESSAVLVSLNQLANDRDVDVRLEIDRDVAMDGESLPAR